MKPAPLIALAALAACGPDPRSPAWFEAHPDVAGQTVKACWAKAQPPVACRNARMGLIAARRAARMAADRKAF
jgi:hypothetical protein